MRLINVSNRLPVSITNMDGKYNITRSIGGVATGLSSFLKHYKTENKEVLWLGWPGISLKDDGMLKKLLSEQDCHPVHLSQNLMDNFYYGFCNQTLWPLFHCMPSLAHYQEDHWVAYQQVNAEFFDAISSIIQPGDVVWIHDYHFLLLPRMIKEKFPLINVGFFLNISFP